MIGDRIHATLKDGTDEVKASSIKMQNIDGEVIFENPYYMTIQTKNYRTSINKRAVLCGEVVIR